MPVPEREDGVEPSCSLRSLLPAVGCGLRAERWLAGSCTAPGAQRAGLLTGLGVSCISHSGGPGRAPGRKDGTGAMGQLCCFPFSRDEEKISDKNGSEPDDAELVKLSKRLVENAVLKAVQQYLEETQNKNKPGDGSSVKTEEADRNGTDNDNRK